MKFYISHLGYPHGRCISSLGVTCKRQSGVYSSTASSGTPFQNDGDDGEIDDGEDGDGDDDVNDDDKGLPLSPKAWTVMEERRGCGRRRW